jgi:hypothetical protein
MTLFCFSLCFSVVLTLVSSAWFVPRYLGRWWSGLAFYRQSPNFSAENLVWLPPFSLDVLDPLDTSKRRILPHLLWLPAQVPIPIHLVESCALFPVFQVLFCLYSTY